MPDEPLGPDGANAEAPSGPYPPALFWLFWCGPPLALMTVIFWMGTDRASATETRSLLAALLDRYWHSLYVRLSPDLLLMLNVGVRKAGHFLGYALLGLLDARAARGLRGRLGRAEIAGAWTAATAWAGVDEFHQSYSPSRGAAVEDVVLDTFGAVFGIWFYQLWNRRAMLRS